MPSPDIGILEKSNNVETKRSPIGRGLVQVMACGIKLHDRMRDPDFRVKVGYVSISIGLSLIRKANPAAGLVVEVGLAAFNTYLEKSAVRESLDS